VLWVALISLSDPLALQCFLEGAKQMVVTWWQVYDVWGMVQHLPEYAVQHALATAMWWHPLRACQGNFFLLIVVHITHSPINFDQLRTLRNKELNDTYWPIWTNSAPGTPTFKHVTPFLFALVCLFCCTSHDQQLLVRHA
jgi:hypothetical protein